MMRTVVMQKKLSSSMESAERQMKKALRELRDAVQPGLTVSDADKIVRDIVNDGRHGGSLITRSGYSIGIAFPPSWDEGYILSLMQGDPQILKEGMTFHIIPWVWGVDGDKTVGISDTFYVTEDGCESFFDLPEEFTLKPPEKSADTKPKPKPKKATNGEAVTQ